MCYHRSAVRLGIIYALASLAILGSANISHGDEPRARPAGPANRLAKETSPYLLLHAHNPVDWYPWGPEAFAKAKAENKPIFLSIGYSSCYWCHVMERESFMNPEVARILNAGYVAIKVDREERPDVDQVYMTAVQAVNGSGGWPMSVFLTPDGRPFFGGTYFPVDEFTGILNQVSEVWKGRRPEIEKDADALSAVVKKASAGPSASGPASAVPLTRELAGGGRAALAEQFDPEFGGFGFDPARPKRPKFPEPVNLLYLLDQGRRDQRAGGKKPDGPDPLAMALKTFDAMARGGIRDHLAGGYHRYSTVRDWSVPHFEKMLYDNAQIAEALVLAYEATGDARWKLEAEATFGFVARTMTAPEGTFFSSLDAESQGEEGKSYVWTRAEVESVLGSGDDFARFARVYGLDAKPNFDGGRYVLLEPAVVPPAIEASLSVSRAKLLAARDRRPSPSLDDKILTSWNALMIAAEAEGARVLKDERCRVAADRAADALLKLMTGPDGRLLRTARGGKAKLASYLEDDAALIYALVRLHAATGEPRRLVQAKTLADRMINDFVDREAGGFFFTAGDHETLIARVKDPFDNAVPGANSLAIRALVGLGVATGEARYLDEAKRALGAFGPSLLRRPGGSPLMLLALEEYLDARPPSPLEPPPTSAPLPGAPGVLTATAGTPRPAIVDPGGEFEVELRLNVKANYHIYANPAGSDDVIPTVLRLAPGAQGRLVEVRYPAGDSKVLTASGPSKVSVYEKAVAIVARIQVAAAAEPGPSTYLIQIRYQACDDRACLAPATLDVPVVVEVKRSQ